MNPNRERLDRLAFNNAYEYLLELPINEIDEQLLEQYMEPENFKNSSYEMRDIFRRFVESAQNSNMKARVIGGSINGIENLSDILYNFNPYRTFAEYGTDYKRLLDKIILDLKPNGRIRREPTSLWPKFCHSVLSEADFLSKFNDKDDFFKWVDFFDNDARARASLPLLIKEEVYGIGFALACDFLKEIGFITFPKPDIHMKKIFLALELCPRKASDFELFKSIVRVAKNSNKTPYAVDKVFWLIGSGHFYNNPELGNNGRIGRKRDDFINIYAKTK